MTAPNSRAYTMADFTPSSTPGCRLPFAKLADGRPVYDALGPGYTLLRYDPEVTMHRWRKRCAPAACRSRWSMSPPAKHSRPAPASSSLARTDQHVAWRGDAVPERLDDLVDTLRGVTTR